MSENAKKFWRNASKEQIDEKKRKTKETMENKSPEEKAEMYKKCMEGMRKTCLEKYGVENYSTTEECREKMKKTCLEKYGVENSSQNKEIYEKIKQTNLRKYGYTTHSQTEKHKTHMKEVLLNKSEEEKLETENKRIETFRKKYGKDYFVQSEEGKKKILESIQNKYGEDHPMHVKEIREKVKHNSIKHKPYILPSGKEIFIQGYEDKALDFLLQYFNEDEIDYSPNSIKYTFEGEKSYYFPDFFIPSLKLIVEAKSDYILELQGVAKNEAKFEACRNLNYSVIMILNNNFEEIKRFLNENKSTS